MTLWRAVLLVNLAFGIGLAFGYLAWGRQIPRLVEQAEIAREQAGVVRVERTWTVRGVVRAVLPDMNVVVLTHEDIPGYMRSMTMGFRVHDPQLYRGLDIGENVRVTLRGAPPNVVITAIERDPAR
ncbi:MAG TPA: copper-binding protein [Methylomirabilota bacterium]|nr:copper-binding protein [Methylomirabilota bacterium]